MQMLHNNSMKTTSRRLILWRTEPLLGKDRETNNETTAVARQQPARQWTS
jgi:hypothetical protein